MTATISTWGNSQGLRVPKGIMNQLRLSIGDKVNIFVNVVDGQSGKRFEVSDITQGFNPELSYDKLADKHCGYIPSWVMLDKDGKLLTSSCGSEKGIDIIKKILDSELK